MLPLFYAFCTTYNVSTPFPLSKQLLCSFAAYLADQDLAPQTIKSYLLVLCNMQISPDPREQSSLPVLKRVQAGISRTRMLKGSPPLIRLPIMVHLLEQVRASLTMSADPNRLAIWVIASSAFLVSSGLESYYQHQYPPSTQQKVSPGVMWQPTATLTPQWFSSTLKCRSATSSVQDQM